ncbi:type II toxin-antitoxin system RelE/ParE family toxin [Mucilaginibacter myungsuensis]|uniref:mRNA-degrading endonuclease RelE of RelBE toxin-antitoxin system n=1 Tax=Mucilaginibacter myungsuensis TaxID=649104 RepID=A0A929KXB0_9SPHI|nr:hypothetical protein [Mucilaginibacter myungsuensis]MBE9663356.1 hypothetical protein [Mucilaginibacter myungsuensis]MDN3600091.1 hypothetical protein [Mucilaginibacter myungsuensis]
MNYKIEAAGDFSRNIKDLAKKYPSLKTDLQVLRDSLLLNPTQEDKIYKNTYKVRLAIASKSKGKSGGARVITHLVATVQEGVIYLLTIYDKSQREIISDDELSRLIKTIRP